MDYFRLLCLDLVTKKINPSIITSWETHKLSSLSDNGTYRQEIIGGKQEITLSEIEPSSGIYIF